MIHSGANSFFFFLFYFNFILEQISFHNRTKTQEGKQEVTKVISLVKMADNVPGVSSPLKSNQSTNSTGGSIVSDCRLGKWF